MSIFSKIQKTKLPGNKFDLTHDRKFSGNMGKLIPMMVMDCIPGDKISIKSSSFVRFAPLVAPVMHQVSVYMHYFFVPNRLLWKNWEKFISGGEDGYDSSVFPTITPWSESSASVNGNGSLLDYLGLPPFHPDQSVDSDTKVSALPFQAYQLIWNEYYRDQNLQNAYDYELVDGVQTDTLGNALLRESRNRAWQHDYFTSALPWAQKGPEAMLPLGSEAPVYAYPHTDAPSAEQQWRSRLDGSVDEGGTDFVSLSGMPAGQPNFSNISQPETLSRSVYLDLKDTHYADLSTATASSINDLRRAFKLQEWLEKNARGGSRYIESIAVHFGVQSSDARLQRPEYLGGSSTPIKISEVLQMSETDRSPQGNMSGHGVGVGSNGWVSKYCEEHGYILGIMSVMPRSAYQQGIPRHFSKFDKFDFYWPEFAHIGEQEIKNQELYFVQDDIEDNEATFGYTPRYSEYKYMNSSVHGDYRDSLDFWHMGRKFASRPALNSEFIEMDSDDIDSRIFAVTDNSDNLWCHVLNEVKAYRKMPVFGTPKM